MYLETDFPPGGVRLAQLMRVVGDFERNEVEAAVDGLLAFLDQLDGDPDLEDGGDAEDNADTEANGDEGDHNGSEDCFILHYDWGRPGCPIADPDHGAEDQRVTGAGDPSWAEWHTRGRHKLTAHGAEPTGGDCEDAEDDDPREQDDEPEDDDPAGGNVTDEKHDAEDEDREEDCFAARQPHRNRIRRTRCDRIVQRNPWWIGSRNPVVVNYRLRRLGRARLTTAAEIGQ